ncbi:uncharacterized protein [Arachis hypogaea]|uniref:uncharacterized protein n=1 Tax=Arachis hypogaea TaxID=3818 RepID=UPI003B21BFEC
MGLRSSSSPTYPRVPSLANFDDLTDQFVNHFAASKIYVHNSDYLSTIKQGLNESLKGYMTKFAEATNEIPNLNPKVHLHSLKSGLRPGKFQESIEEERRNRHSAGKTDQRSFRLTPKFDSYTPFNTKREGIVKDILHSKLIKAPNRAGTYQDQRHMDRSKYCAFHQKYDHTTDDCVIAKDVLEKLAHQGLLDKYIDSRGRRQSIEGLGQQPKMTDNSPRQWKKGQRTAGKEDPDGHREQRGRAVLLNVPKNESERQNPPTLIRRTGRFLRDYPNSRTLEIQYLVVDCKSPYNIILGRPSLNAFNAIVSTVHLCVKFLSQDNKVVTIHGDQKEARQCYNACLNSEQPKQPDQQYVQAVYNSE